MLTESSCQRSIQYVYQYDKILNLFIHQARSFFRIMTTLHQRRQFRHPYQHKLHHQYQHNHQQYTVHQDLAKDFTKTRYNEILNLFVHQASFFSRLMTTLHQRHQFRHLYQHRSHHQYRLLSSNLHWSAQTIDSPFVSATQSEAYESPFSADFYDPQRVLETELATCNTPLPKCLPCFVSIAPLIDVDQYQWIQRVSRRNNSITPESVEKSGPTPMSECGFDFDEFILPT